ncbi:MAG: hypothetical protein ACE5KW_00740 [Dehalococcoidia bacterium]
MDKKREPKPDQGFWNDDQGEEEIDSRESVAETIRRATAALTEVHAPTPEDGQPRQPSNFVELGLSKAFLIDLTLKMVHYASNPTTAQLVRRLRVSPRIVEQLIAALTEERLCEVISQSDLYTGNYRYRLTSRGQERVAEALERSHYAGPVPVTAEQYFEVVLSQQQKPQAPVSRGRAKEVKADLVLAPQVADAVARALFSGKSAMFFGPSGNGKTRVLTRFAASIEGEVLVPYAIYAHGQLIRVFDPSVHHVVETPDERNSLKDDGKIDRRWIRVKRPGVVLSIEMGPESLDLAYDPMSRFYTAPPHIKAQGGVVIVDDFGRQRVRPQDLLARWLIAMERGWESLTLVTGEQVRLPFNIQLLLATNQPLQDLADEPLLRRILYKVEMPNPTPTDFAEILRRLCHHMKVLVPEGAIDYVIKRLFEAQSDLEPRAAFARDLVDLVVESARYDNQEPVLTPEAFDRAFRLFMAQYKAERGG